MFKLYDRVKIKKNGITGIIVDISKMGNKSIYTIESDIKGKVEQEGVYPSLWALYDCFYEEIEKVK